MVAAFGTTKPNKPDPRLLTRFPRLDRGTLARSGALQPGMRTSWAIRDPAEAARALSIELAAATDGLTISTGDQVQVVRYWYDIIGSYRGLRLSFRCPLCERVCYRLHFDGCWGCRVCLGLKYPTRVVQTERALMVHRIEDLQRKLIKVRPGSRLWKSLRAQIVEHHAILAADVARVRRCLRRRLKKDYKR